MPSHDLPSPPLLPPHHSTVSKRVYSDTDAAASARRPLGVQLLRLWRQRVQLLWVFVHLLLFSVRQLLWERPLWHEHLRRGHDHQQDGGPPEAKQEAGEPEDAGEAEQEAGEAEETEKEEIAEGEERRRADDG